MYEAGPEAFLEGWRTSEPLIRADTRVIAFGSCFAARFAEWLVERGYNRAFRTGSDDSIFRNPLETPLVVAQQFRWAFGELDSDLAFWVGQDKRHFAATEERRLRLRSLLLEADVLIITLGLAETWYDTRSGEPIWRVPPRALADRYAFKVATVSECVAALETIDRLRRAHLPNVKIVYSVSPLRLSATFRAISPIVANAASKAILRAAVDEFVSAHAAELNETYFYFPAYEIVTELLHDPLVDNVHIHDHHAAYVLEVFARFFTDLPPEPGKDPRFPASPLDELLETISTHDRHAAELQALCDELQAVCDERAALIEELHASLEDHPAMLAELAARNAALQAACDERGALIERLSEAAT